VNSLQNKRQLLLGLCNRKVGDECSSAECMHYERGFYVLLQQLSTEELIVSTNESVLLLTAFFQQEK